MLAEVKVTMPANAIRNAWAFTSVVVYCVSSCIQSQWRPVMRAVWFIIPALLSACVSQSKYDELKAQNDQLQQQVSRLQGAIKYTVNSDLLFPSGGWQMSPQGQEIIAKLAVKLAPTQQNKLVVNGYTDNVPISPRLQQQGVTSNEVLSQKRAENVMKFLVSQGISPNLVSAHGLGEANPVASNDTAQGRAQNRRVELALAPVS